jgi:hypothetical protein
MRGWSGRARACLSVCVIHAMPPSPWRNALPRRSRTPAAGSLMTASGCCGRHRASLPCCVMKIASPRIPSPLRASAIQLACAPCPPSSHAIARMRCAPSSRRSYGPPSRARRDGGSVPDGSGGADPRSPYRRWSRRQVAGPADAIPIRAGEHIQAVSEMIRLSLNEAVTPSQPCRRSPPPQ